MDDLELLGMSQIHAGLRVREWRNFMRTTLLMTAALATSLFGAPKKEAVLIPATEIRAAAAKSIELLEKVHGQWKQDCISCHHQTLPMMAIASARQRGVAVNETIGQAHAKHALRSFGAVDFAVQANFIIDPALSDGSALFAAHAAGMAPNLTTAIYARRIANYQQPDGHWTTFDGRPPHSYSTVTTTAMAIRSMALYMPSQLSAERQERTRRAVEWLTSQKPRATEELAFRVLGLVWAGAPAELIRTAAADVVLAQRTDGAWGASPALPVDAYSTGQALYALRLAGIPAKQAPFQRGLQWLLSAQKADGSWQVKSRMHTPAPISPPYYETGFPYGKDQIISCAGTSWALMAMMEALPVTVPAPTPWVSSEVPGTATWMTTALFGRTADLAKLLDEKLDPNTATPAGTSLLMFAAHDPAKVALLLERGANPLAMAKSGYNALTVASVYRGSAPVVKMLLAKGVPAAAGKTQFNASPMFLAALAGDTESVKVLAAAGAPLARRMLMVGMIETSPLQMATLQNDTAMVKTLLDLGYDLEEKDRNGMTALAWTVLQGKTATRDLLIVRGASQTGKDSFGLTPLDHVNGMTRD